MDGIGAAFTALGALSCAGLSVVLTITGLVLPIWSIIDCATSERSDTLKAVWLVFMVLFWGIVSLAYGMIAASSKALRLTTIITVIIVIILLAFSIVGLGTGWKLHQEQYSKQQVENRKRNAEEKAMQLQEFQPPVAPQGAVEPFTALLMVAGEQFQKSVSIAEFNQEGVIPETARSIDSNVRHITADPESGTVYALSDHEFGVLSVGGSELKEIELDDSVPRLSWPGGLAYDPKRRRVVLISKGGEGHVYSYQPETESWSLLGSMEGTDIAALAYSPGEDVFYAIEAPFAKDSFDTLLQLSPQGAILSRTNLTPSVPFARVNSPRVQLKSVSGKLVMLIDSSSLNRPALVPGMYIIDPRTGELTRASEPLEPEEEPEDPVEQPELVINKSGSILPGKAQSGKALD